MDDRRVESLIRMAAEIEELERGAVEAPPLRLVSSSGQVVVAGRRRAGVGVWCARIGTFAAAAACVALAVHLGRPGVTAPDGGGKLLASRTDRGAQERGAAEVAAHGQGGGVKVTDAGGSPVQSQAPAAVTAKITPEHAARLIEALEAPFNRGSGVLAIYQDAMGVVRCVKWKAHEFEGGRLEEVEPGELVRATYGGHQCVVGPHRVIAVGISGPREKLPDSPERAAEFVQCIVGDSATIACEIEPAPASGMMTCLPSGMQVVVETLAMGKF